MTTAKTVFITGAGIGIGRATAPAFARDGYHVVVTDILADEGSKAAGSIKSDGGSAEFHVLDVTSTEDADRVVGTVQRSHGPIDCLVANAGIAHKVPLDQLTDDRWDYTMEIDFKGEFRVARAAIPAMRRKKAGSIVCLSSIMGIASGWDEHVHYSAAKAGVIGLVHGLAVELAREGIRVNGIAPGYIRTAQALSKKHSLGPAGLEKAAEFIPMGRVGEPEDIADVALFLASDAARYLIVQVIAVHEFAPGLCPSRRHIRARAAHRRPFGDLGQDPDPRRRCYGNTD